MKTKELKSELKNKRGVTGAWADGVLRSAGKIIYPVSRMFKNFCFVSEWGKIKNYLSFRSFRGTDTRSSKYSSGKVSPYTLRTLERFYRATAKNNLRLEKQRPFVTALIDLLDRAKSVSSAMRFPFFFAFLR